MAAKKTKVVQKTTDTGETKTTTAAKKAATQKQFANADDAVIRGLPADMTVEQHENFQRRGALGY